MSDKTLQSAGPLLAGVLAAQELEEHAVRYPQLERIADQVIQRARELPHCVVWPIGAAAERVAAAVTLRSRGAVEVGAWNTDVAGRELLLVAVAAVSSLGVEAAAAQLRRRGAGRLHGCGVAVPGTDSVSILDSYTRLTVLVPTSAPVALIDDAA
jgi:predicted dinucleotide-utilizing enzyme